MVKLQRNLALMVCLVMLLTILAACGSNNDKPAASPSASATESSHPTTSASPEQSMEPLKEVTLKIVTAGDDRPAKQEVLDALYELTKDRLNAKFEINFIPFGDYQSKLTLMASSGDKYDAAFTADWFGYANMVNKGAFLDLSDLMPQYAPNLYKFYEENNMLSSASVNGKLIGVPWTEIKTSKPVFNYRKDIADKLNVQAGDLTTIEGIDTFLTAIAAAKPGMTVYDMAMKGDAGDIVTLLQPKYELLDIGFNTLYIDVNDATAKVIPLEQTEMFKEAVHLAKKWYDSGVISKNALADKENSPFETGKVFAGKSTSGALFEVTNFTDKSAVKDAVEVYPNNKFARDSQMNNAMAINANAANPERMLMFMELLSTDRAVYDTFFYGIKDKTYTLDGDIVGFTTAEDPAKPLWQSWFNWGFYRSAFARPTASSPAEAMKNNLAYATRANIVPSPLAGFVPSPDAIKTELTQRSQYSSEQGKLLLAGVIKGDVDTAINTYIEKQKAANLDKIIADVQKQIDEFLTKK
jgi:putative aldouronate transport system substrate-binding protein